MMNSTAFYLKLREHPRPVVVDVWAPWCGPCRMIEPALRKLEQEFAGKVDLWKINADEHRQLIQELRIYGIPTTLAFRGANEVLRITGAQPQGSLAKLFEAALTGEVAQKSGVTPPARFIRAAFGLGAFLIMWWLHLPAIGYILGAAILFTAVYDRCPVWQAISPRLAKYMKKVIK